MDGAVRGVSRLDFGQATSSIVPLSRDLYPALGGLASSASMLFDVVKFEILRDFQQMVSVVVNGVRFPNGFRAVWGSVSGFFSICFSCWFAHNASNIANTIYTVQCVLAIAVFVRFYRLQARIQPRDSVSGLETVSWSMIRTSDKNRIKLYTLVLTTLYLPVVRDITQVMLCDARFVPDVAICYRGFHAFELVVAILAAAIFAIPTPLVFYRIIERNMPQPSFFDQEGLSREGGYTDQNYRDDVAASTSPFKSLFEPYERKWAFHKVVVMVIKVLVVLPTAVMVTSNQVGHKVGSDNVARLLLIQSIVTILVLGFYALWCWRTKPYLNPRDDMLDSLNRFAILCVAMIGLISSQTESSAIVFAVLAHVLSAVAFVTTTAMIIGSIAPVQSAIRNWRQAIKLTTHASGYLVLSDALSLRKARKLRIWHEFWDVLFAQDVEYRLPNRAKPERDYHPVELDYKYGNSPPFLLQFRGTVCERHRENVAICQHESLESYRAAIAAAIDMRLQPDSGLHRDVALLTKYICGVDVFWDGAVESGAKEWRGASAKARVTAASTSATHFGRAYVVPFPLTVVMIFDDVNEETVFSLSPVVNGVARDQSESMSQLANFVAVNLSPEVIRRRHIRRMLRAMHACTVYHVFQCVKQKTKSRTKTDSSGKSVQESYVVNVLFTFRNGTFLVGQESGAEWTDPATGHKLNVAHGFRPSIHYTDGVGTDHEGKRWSGEHHSLSAGDLGITDDYRLDAADPVSVNFVRFLSNNWVRHESERANSLSALNDLMGRYRLARLDEFNRKESAMSYAFWYFVYNHDRISQYALTACLQRCEANPMLNQLASKHSFDVTMLYQKLAFFDSHPAAAYWFTFWHDFWIWNQDLHVVQAHKAQFDPFNSVSVCYTVLPREQLVQRLHPTGILGRKSLFGLKLGFINSQVLTRFYERLDRCAESPSSPPQPGQIHEAATSPTSTSNPIDITLLNEMKIVEMYHLSQYATGSDYDIQSIISSLGAIPIYIPDVPDPLPVSQVTHLV